MDERAREIAPGVEALVAMQRMHALRHRVVTIGFGSQQEPTVGERPGSSRPPHAFERSDVTRHDRQRRVKDVEGEPPARLEMRAHGRQACEPIGVREVVQKRPERNDDDGESRRQRERAHVVPDHRDAASHVGRERCGLPFQRGEHVSVGVERVNRVAVPGEGQRDAARPGAELEDRATRRAHLLPVPLENRRTSNRR